MTQKLSDRGRPSTRQLLHRILEAPDLAAQVRALSPPALGALIDRIGLEDAGELVAFATADQLAAVFDDDLWRSRRAGEDEIFDAARFLLWLEVMLEAGDRFVATRLFELDTELVTLAFHRHLLVLDMDSLVAEMQGGGDDVDTIEKALDDCLFEELDEYRLIARRHEGWDSLLGAILALDRDHHDYLVKILDRCAKMASEYIEDNGGLYEVLTSEEMLEGDVAAEREDRRAEAGHVAPSAAAAFLKLARMPVEHTTERDPLTRAWFRSLAKRAEPITSKSASPSPRHDLLSVLAQSEVIDREAPRLPSAAGDAHRPSLLARALHELVEPSPDAFAARSEELAYLANVLSSGCELQGRRMRPAEAVQIALATCNLGLELVMASEDRTPAEALTEHPADRLFRVAWSRLNADVGEHGLMATLAEIETIRARIEPREPSPIGPTPRRTARGVRSSRPTRAR